MDYPSLAEYFAYNPHDVHTVPFSRSPIWFYVYEEAGTIYVEQARMHLPSSKIKQRRSLNQNEFDAMLKLYRRRKNGESVSAEAARTTLNQVYWYGIFAELKL